MIEYSFPLHYDGMEEFSRRYARLMLGNLDGLGRLITGQGFVDLCDMHGGEPMSYEGELLRPLGNIPSAGRRFAAGSWDADISWAVWRHGRERVYFDRQNGRWELVYAAPEKGALWSLLIKVGARWSPWVREDLRDNAL